MHTQSPQNFDKISSMAKKNYITPEGFLKLKEELEQLTTVERPQTVKVVSWAAGNGDRSENADYQYGKRKLRQIDRRLRFLHQRINTAVVVDPSHQNTDKVVFGVYVTVANDEEEKTIQIVGVDEIDLPKGKISYLSPLGKALMGKVEGDEVNVKSPGGEVIWEVCSIFTK